MYKLIKDTNLILKKNYILYLNKKLNIEYSECIKIKNDDDFIGVLRGYYSKMNNENLSNEKIKLKLLINGRKNVDVISVVTLLVTAIIGIGSMFVSILAGDKLNYEFLFKIVAKIYALSFGAIVLGILNYGLFSFSDKTKFNMICLYTIEEVLENRKEEELKVLNLAMQESASTLDNEKKDKGLIINFISKVVKALR